MSFIIHNYNIQLYSQIKGHVIRSAFSIIHVAESLFKVFIIVESLHVAESLFKVFIVVESLHVAESLFKVFIVAKSLHIFS